MIAKKRYVFSGLFLAVFAAGFVLWYLLFPRVSEVEIDPASIYHVVTVIDGDTIKVRVNTHVITVRLLGINTPETVDPRKPVECYGPEASTETKNLLTGREVRLTESPNRELKDKYGRYLLYVYRSDGLFVNEFLLREGYAREYTVGTAYSFQQEFRDIEKSAKTADRGLWKACS